jgi:ribonuclease Z
MIKTEIKSRNTEDICVAAYPDNHPRAYFFDCGVASNMTISDAMRAKAVFVTHTHVDHFANFDFFIRNRAGSPDPLVVTGPAGIAKNVQAKFHAYTWNLLGGRSSWFEVREAETADSYKVFRLYSPRWELKLVEEVKGSDQIFAFERFRARYCVLSHKIPSIAYRFMEADAFNISKDFPYSPGPWINTLKKAFREENGDCIIDADGQQIRAAELFPLLSTKKGMHIGFVMDHLGGGENHRLLRDFMAGVDELYIEGFFRHVDFDYASRHHHSTAYLSGLLAKEAGVKKLILAHFSRRYLADLPDLIEEGHAAFEGREPVYRQKPEPKYTEVDKAM